MIRYRILSAILGAIALWHASISAVAGSTLMVSPSAHSNFVLQGTGIEKIAGLELTRQYDSSNVPNPRAV